MADAPKPNQPADAATAPDAAKPSWWKLLLTPRWVAVFVAVSLVIHSIIFVLVRRATARPTIPPEYTVGVFNLVAASPGESHGVPSKFELHLRFIDDLQLQANLRISNHQFRVREAIENLLRKSRGIELDDQAIARLKHQIQKQIDQAIDLRAVAEVMITDLTIEPLAGEAPPTNVRIETNKERSTIPTSTAEEHVDADATSTPASPSGY